MASDTAISQTEPTLPPELIPNVDHLVTEDGAPVDNIYSEKQQRLLVEPLYSSWSGVGPQRPFVAMSNVGLFFAIGQPPYVPDMLLSLDVQVPADLWPKSHRSYFLWEYGKPPEVVVELVSNREGGEDSDKLAGYARIGVSYYVIFDPEQQLSGTVLRAYQRSALSYQPLPSPIWLPGVELGLNLWQGRYEDHENTWLRWVDRTGMPIPTGAEQAQQQRQEAEQQRQEAEQQRQEAEQQRQEAEQQRQEAEQQRQEAEQQRQEAEQQRQEAQQQRQRAEALAEQLRAMGAEPTA